MSERVAGEPVWILHRRPWRETSLHLELLARHHGRVAVLARGYRRPRLAAALPPEPFRPFLASWTLRAPGGLGTLVDLEGAGPPVRLGGEALWAAFHLSETLLRVLPRGVPQEGVHDLYARALGDLARVDGGTEGLRARVRLFEKALLDALGFGPDFRHAAPDAAPLDPARTYRTRIDGHGVLVLEPAAGGTPGALFLALADERLDDPEVLRLADRLLPACLAAHARGPGRGRRVFADVRRLLAPSPVPLSAEPGDAS